jgi:hypothetical protein
MADEGWIMGRAGLSRQGSATPDGGGPAGGAAARRGTRAGATGAPLRGRACSLSSEMLRRSASMRLITHRGVGMGGLPAEWCRPVWP